MILQHFTRLYISSLPTNQLYRTELHPLASSVLWAHQMRIAMIGPPYVIMARLIVGVQETFRHSADAKAAMMGLAGPATL